MSVVRKTEPAVLGEAEIQLKPANAHVLVIDFGPVGRMKREFSREQVAVLADAMECTSPSHAHALIAAFLPGYSREEYAALVRAVREFERHAAIEAERENPRHWPSIERMAL